jgi:transposase-like protein
VEVILRTVRWYPQFSVICRDFERVLIDHGVQVDHTSLFRWIEAYASELDKRIHSRCGQPINALLSSKCDRAAARQFFRKALRQPHTASPRTVMVGRPQLRLQQKP